MSERWKFEDKREFLKKIEELIEGGASPKDIDVLTPIPVDEVDELLKAKPSLVRFFTLGGALLGALVGLAFPILTVLDWPIITGGKPFISIPPFVIISFACTILLGAIFSFIGFLVLGRLPSRGAIEDPEEHDNYFVVLYHGREGQ